MTPATSATQSPRSAPLRVERALQVLATEES